MIWASRRALSTRGAADTLPHSTPALKVLSGVAAAPKPSPTNTRRQGEGPNVSSNVLIPGRHSKPHSLRPQNSVLARPDCSSPVLLAPAHPQQILHNPIKTMSSTPTKQSESDGISATTAAAQAYLDSIGLRSVLKDGVVRLLETNPLPASTLAAGLVLATEIIRIIKAQGHGQSNDAAASSMLAGFESLVRGG